MRSRLSIALVAVVLGGLAVACAQTSIADVSRRHVAVVIDEGHATVQEVVDLGKSGFGTGDQVLEEAPVTDSAGKTVGDSFTTLTITSGKSLEVSKGLIDCSINLGRGTILFNGYVDLAKLDKGITIPVIGGTGAYSGAGGSVRMTKPDEPHTNLDFSLLIPKAG
jgi:hypothetical protein